MKIAVCIASGPSTTDEQIDLLKYYRSDLFVCCVNDAYLLFPSCDIIFAADRKWWRKRYHKVCESVTTRRFYTLERHNPYKNKITEIKHSNTLDQCTDDVVYHGSNSGQMAIHLLQKMKFQKIILIGFDFKKSTEGKVHFFGDHTDGLINATNMIQWREKFDPFVKFIEDKVDLVNCSNDTTINSIRRSTLEIELATSIQQMIILSIMLKLT